MATVTNKDFKIKSGLVVEGTTGTINGYDILTESQASQDFIISVVGGSATSANTPDTVVLRDENGDFAAGIITADLVGDVTGQVSDISNHDTDDLTEGTNNLYFQDNRAQTAVSNALGSGLGYGSEGAGNVFYVDTNVIATKTFATDEANAAQAAAEQTAANDATTKANNAQSAAEQTAAADATNKANQALSDAEDYADGKISDANGSATDKAWSAYKTYTEISLAEGRANDYADGISGDVQDNLDAHTILTSGVHGVTGDVVGTTDAQTISNKTLGSDLAAGGYKVSGLAQPSANQDAATKSYVDTAVSNLIGAAPELLDTLNELAEAIGDDEDFIGTVTASIGEKVAKAGDSMSGNLDFGGTNKVTSLGAPTSNGDATNKLYVDTEISDLDASLKTYADQSETDAKAYTDTREIAITSAYESYADTAEADAVTTANAYTDGRETAITTAYEAYADQAESDAVSTANSYTDDEITTALSTAQGYANTAEQNAKDYADALDTDDVSEGSTNLYFTDGRAKTSAAQLLTSANLTNITITGTGAGLTITAENGVADSTTSDLAEGTRLYFTNQRAIDALQNTTPTFSAVDINSIAKQVAGTTVVPVAGIATAYSWAKADYRSAEFLVKIAQGDHTEVSKVLLTLHDNDNISITEYGIVGTNGNLGNVSAVISGNDVQLQVTTINNTSTLTVVGTLLA